MLPNAMRTLWATRGWSTGKITMVCSLYRRTVFGPTYLHRGQAAGEDGLADQRHRHAWVRRNSITATNMNSNTTGKRQPRRKHHSRACVPAPQRIAHCGSRRTHDNAAQRTNSWCRGSLRVLWVVLVVSARRWPIDRILLSVPVSSATCAVHLPVPFWPAASRILSSRKLLCAQRERKLLSRRRCKRDCNRCSRGWILLNHIGRWVLNGTNIGHTPWRTAVQPWSPVAA